MADDLTKDIAAEDEEFSAAAPPDPDAPDGAASTNGASGDEEVVDAEVVDEQK